MTQLLYDFSEGTTKKRSSAEGIVHQREGYRTAFISVGEFSIFDRCAKLEGLNNRIMELDAPFTRDADHAKRLERGTFDHCGHGAEVMASYILSNGGQAAVEGIYDQFYESFSQKASASSPSANRFISTFAAPLLTTAQLANASWNLSIQLNDVEEYLLLYLKTKEKSSDIVKERYETIIELCLRNKGMFHLQGALSHMNDFNAKDAWGILEQPKCGSDTPLKIWLYSTQLQKLCDEYNFPSAKNCMKAWKERGWVETEQDRLTKRNKSKTAFYVLIAKDFPKYEKHLCIQSDKQESCDEVNTNESTDCT